MEFSNHFNGYPDAPRSEWDYIIKYGYGPLGYFTGIERCFAGDTSCTVGEVINKLLRGKGVRIISVDVEHKDLAKIMMEGLGNVTPKNLPDRGTEYGILVGHRRYK